jgi:hypothetical protein
LGAPIYAKEVCDSVKKVKNKKASVGDLINNNEIIKIAVEVLARHFAKIFNAVLKRGVFPRVWSEGLIVPLHKSGSRLDPVKYRGICISSCLDKLFTRLPK